jgi:hypothetical protein
MYFIDCREPMTIVMNLRRMRRVDVDRDTADLRTSFLQFGAILAHVSFFLAMATETEFSDFVVTDFWFDALVEGVGGCVRGFWVVFIARDLFVGLFGLLLLVLGLHHVLGFFLIVLGLDDVVSCVWLRRFLALGVVEPTS